MNRGILVMAFSATICSCGDSTPNVDTETYDRVNPFWNLPYVEVKVKAIEDDVTANDIIVNRDSCKLENRNIITGRAILPKKLKFGESVSVSFSGPCRASQVDVITDNESWTATY